MNKAWHVLVLVVILILVFSQLDSRYLAALKEIKQKGQTHLHHPCPCK